ncbi:hypothetical protein FRB96_008697 [Tulasnella sp. 330]|nr:hypothetical protein FRB96_008697 [Tulasnella sp. 330]
MHDELSDSMLSTPGASSSRSSSPDSSITTNASFIRASNTIDDLTRALASFSRGPSLELPDTTACCCGREDCEASSSWMTARGKLEKELELSAEIGQALLQRHEAYVRRQDNLTSERERTRMRNQARIDSLQDSNNTLVSKMAELIREGSQMEKARMDMRCAHAEVNLEISDSSNRTLLKELQETRSTIARLTTRNSLLIGVESRLAEVTQERNDLIQERDAEAARAKSAEAKIASIEARSSELEAETRRLEDEFAASQTYREDFSEVLLRDARARLEGLQDSLRPSAGGDPEVHRILEGLVADNEAIKRDNAELQNILAELREDLRLAKEDLEERPITRASTSPVVTSSVGRRTSLKLYTHERRASTATGGSSWSMPPGVALVNTKSHKSNESWTSSPTSTPLHQSPFPRQLPSPLAVPHPPESTWVPTPTITLVHKRSRSSDPTSRDVKHNTTGDRSPGGFSVASSAFDKRSVSATDDSLWTPNPAEPSPSKPRTRQRPLMILSRSRGVQTDLSWMDVNEPFRSEPIHGPRSTTAGGAGSSSLPSATLLGLRSSDSLSMSSLGASTPPLRKSTNSDSSSIDFTKLHPGSKSENVPGTNTLPSLIDRVTVLHTRVSQADVHTLNTRLKRQHIVGGDVGHLSKSTLKAIIGDIDALRGQFKTAIDAAKAPGDDGEEPESVMTRKDLRALLKLLKDMLTELTQLRSLLNEVTLDPSKAASLKDRPVSAVIGALGPTRSDSDGDRGRSKGLLVPGAMGWLAAPIQKLFNPVTSTSDTSDDGRSNQRGRVEQKTLRAPRAAPKLAPAISATTTTVNVEFGSSGTKGATVAESAGDVGVDGLGPSFEGRESRHGLASVGSGSLGRSSASRFAMAHNQSSTSTSDLNQNATARNQSLLGIFAGASQTSAPGPKKDTWVVLPKKRTESPESLAGGFNALRRGLTDTSGPGFQSHRQLGMGPGMRATSGYNPHRLSRIVDAVIDDDGASIAPSEVNRTLRSGRNLSDSSIHSTFIRANPIHRLLTPSSVALSAPTTDAITPAETGMKSVFGSFIDRQSVLQTLSRKVSGMTTFSAVPPRSEHRSQSSVASGTLVGQTTPPTPSAASSPPRMIPGHSRNGERSISRRRRSPSLGTGGRSLLHGLSWVPGDSSGDGGGNLSSSFNPDASSSPARKIWRAGRGDMDYN